MAKLITEALAAQPDFGRPGGIPAEEIAPGVAALALDSGLLSRDESVQRTARACALLYVGPFLCVERVGDETTWAILSKASGSKRLLIPPEWRKGGNYEWRKGNLYLPARPGLWRGPVLAFGRAAWRDRFNGFSERAHVTDAALAAVRERIDNERAAAWPGGG
jgi:hypothetical protein